MLYRAPIGAAALVAVLSLTLSGARAFDETKYPDLKGQWLGIGGGQAAQWDPTKPPGNGQQAPLTAEYQAIFDKTLAARASQSVKVESCLPPGMPQTMIGYEPIEIIVVPNTTYVMAAYKSEFRRIYTDGRQWPADLEPSYTGYSIGHWEDTDGDGRFDTLLVETRALKGPRTFDGSGLPMHEDNETIVKERLSLDKANGDLLHDEITTIDHALTKPWTVTRSYRRERNAVWVEFVCSEDNRQVQIGDQFYVVGDDGYLKPTRKEQPPPDLRYFPKRP
jgi:hypothetical protein